MSKDNERNRPESQAAQDAACSQPLFPELFLLEDFRFDGRPLEELEAAWPDDAYRREFAAELAFYQGDTDAALRWFCGETARSVFPLGSIHGENMCYVRRGNYDLFSLGMKRLRQARNEYRDNPRMLANIDLAEATSFACLYTTQLCPDWLANGDFDRFSPMARPYAIYLYARYLHGVGETKHMLGVAEAGLALCQGKGFTIVQIYLYIIRAVGMVETGRLEKAREILLDAFSQARQYQLYSPFIESITILRGELDTVLKQYFPEEYKIVAAEWKPMINGWMIIHNRIQNSSISDLLTLRELQVGFYLCEGLSYKEIAERTGLSLATVNNYLQNIRSKLGVKTSKEIIEYIRWM